MRHAKAFRKLGRNPAHRRATLRNLATSLVLHNSIETTLEKAKELRRVADKLVTLGKKDSLHSRRQAMKYLFQINREESGNSQKLTAVHKLFTEIAPRYKERNGGYTRVVRSRVRDGDKAQMAIIQFVEEEIAEKSAPKRRKRRVAAKPKQEKAPEVAQEEVKAEAAEENVEESQVTEQAEEETASEETSTEEQEEKKE